MFGRYPAPIVLLVVITQFAVSGCLATVRAEPAYVEVGSAPANIEIYPHEYYEGRTVYLVNNNWYYQDGPRWVYYRHEPAPLNRRRAYIRQAPPASRSHSNPTSNRATREMPAPAARPVQRQHRGQSHADRREPRRNEH